MNLKTRLLRSLLLLVSSLLFSCVIAYGQAFPSTSVLDNFNRANENPITGIWTNGVTGTGQCEVFSNTMRGSSGTDDCYATQSYGANQEVFLTLSTGATMNDDTNYFVYACLQPADIGTANVDGYGLRFRRVSTGADQVQLVRIANASPINLGTQYASIEFANGDQVGMRVQSGGTFTLYFNDGGAGWVQVDQVINENTHPCAGTHIGFRASHNTVQVDDFGGGDMPSASSGVFLMILEAK